MITAGFRQGWRSEDHPGRSNQPFPNRIAFIADEQLAVATVKSLLTALGEDVLTQEQVILRERPAGALDSTRGRSRGSGQQVPGAAYLLVGYLLIGAYIVIGVAAYRLFR